MAKIAGVPGVTIEKDFRGNLKNITIDAKKQPEVIKSILVKLGIEANVSPYDKKFVDKILSQKNDTSVKINTADLWK